MSLLFSFMISNFIRQPCTPHCMVSVCMCLTRFPNNLLYLRTVFDEQCTNLCWQCTKMFNQIIISSFKTEPHLTFWHFILYSHIKICLDTLKIFFSNKLFSLANIFLIIILRKSCSVIIGKFNYAKNSTKNLIEVVI